MVDVHWIKGETFEWGLLAVPLRSCSYFSLSHIGDLSSLYYDGSWGLLLERLLLYIGLSIRARERLIFYGIASRTEVTMNVAVEPETYNVK